MTAIINNYKKRQYSLILLCFLREYFDYMTERAGANVEIVELPNGEFVQDLFYIRPQEITYLSTSNDSKFISAFSTEEDISKAINFKTKNDAVNFIKNYMNDFVKKENYEIQVDDLHIDIISPILQETNGKYVSPQRHNVWRLYFHDVNTKISPMITDHHAITQGIYSWDRASGRKLYQEQINDSYN